MRADAPSGPVGRRCERPGNSGHFSLALTRHCVPSRIPSNSLKTKDGAPFYPSPKRTPFRTLLGAGASRFDRQKFGLAVEINVHIFPWR